MFNPFDAVTERDFYRIGYLIDGWTVEFSCEVGTPGEAMIITEEKLGDIFRVTYVERM